MAKNIGSIIDQFRAVLSSRGLSPRSVENYSSNVLHMAAWLKENFDVDILTNPEDGKGFMYQQWVVSRKDFADATRHLNFTSARHFADFLYDGDYIQKPIASIFPAVKVRLKEDDPDVDISPKLYSTDDIKALLSMESRNRVATIRDRAIIALIVLTGLRTSETASLNVGDIRKARATGSNTIVVVRKGGKRARVTIPDVAFKFLDDYLVGRKYAKDDEPLFISQQGGRMSRFAIYDQLAAKQAKLGKATGGHALRHTFTTDAARVGGIATAMVLDNHSSMGMTRHYTHITDADRAATVNNTSMAKALESMA